MAFPISPTNGQIYNEYQYNSTTEAWSKPSVFGLDQYWQFFSDGDRVDGTTYTNNTEKAIMLSVVFNPGNNAGNCVYGIQINGQNVASDSCMSSSAYPRATVGAIIPNNSTYKFYYISGATRTERTWAEYRS